MIKRIKRGFIKAFDAPTTSPIAIIAPLAIVMYILAFLFIGVLFIKFGIIPSVVRGILVAVVLPTVVFYILGGQSDE